MHTGVIRNNFILPIQTTIWGNPPHLDSGATSTHFSVVIAGSSGTPFVWRRVATNVSEWTFASDTPQVTCAMWARLRWYVLNCATDRMVAASILPAMI